MAKVCERIVNVLSDVFFGRKEPVKEEKRIKDEYTLSSVFPTTKVMIEVKKYI